MTLFSSPAQARKAAIVIDADTGEVIYSRRADKRLYPASLTKIMTLYMAFEALEKGEIKLNQQIKVSKRAAGQPPSKLGIKPGDRLTVREAILALVTKSANDVATALGETLGGTEYKFALLMTEKARQLGMKQTRFRNASGLPNRRQLTTARDMALLGRAIRMHFPQYYHYFNTQSFTWKGKKHKNHNNLLANYEGTDGIKTGYIRASGFNLVASVKRNNRRLIGVVFGGRTAKSRDREMARLLDSAFTTLAHRAGGIPDTAALVEPPRSLAPPVPPKKPDMATLVASEEEETDSLSAIAAAASALNSPVAQGDADPEDITAALLPAALQDKKGGQWAIQVGAYSTKEKAEEIVIRAASMATHLLTQPEVNIGRARTENGKILFRARLAGLDKDEAQSSCRLLQRKSLPCRAIAPTQ